MTNKEIISSIKARQDAMKRVRFACEVEVTTYNPVYNNVGGEAELMELDAEDEKTKTFLIDCDDCNDAYEALDKGSDFGAELVLLNEDGVNTGRMIDYDPVGVIQNCGYKGMMQAGDTSYTQLIIGNL